MPTTYEVMDVPDGTPSDITFAKYDIANDFDLIDTARNGDTVTTEHVLKAPTNPAYPLRVTARVTKNDPTAARPEGRISSSHKIVGWTKKTDGDGNESFSRKTVIITVEDDSSGAHQDAQGTMDLISAAYGLTFTETGDPGVADTDIISRLNNGFPAVG
jgi:hypothetical protein